jgi:hypothetical protein
MTDPLTLDMPLHAVCKTMSARSAMRVCPPCRQIHPPSSPQQWCTRCNGVLEAVWWCQLCLCFWWRSGGDAEGN